MQQMKNAADRNLLLLEEMQQKIEKIQNALELSWQGVLTAKELAEGVFERMDAQEKRISELEKKIEKKICYLPKQVQRKNGTGRKEEKTRKTLREVLEENQMRFPITVHRKNWTKSYCFTVQRIENGYACGKTYQDGEVYYSRYCLGLEKGDFELYEEEMNRSLVYTLPDRRA